MRHNYNVVSPFRSSMVSPFDLAWMLLKQWEDLPENWGQPDAPALQYSDDPEINQMITPWPEGTATGWEYGPPVDGQQGAPLSAEEAISRQQERMRRFHIMRALEYLPPPKPQATGDFDAAVWRGFAGGDLHSGES